MQMKSNQIQFLLSLLLLISSIQNGYCRNFRSSQLTKEQLEVEHLRVLQTVNTSSLQDNADSMSILYKQLNDQIKQITSKTGTNDPTKSNQTSETFKALQITFYALSYAQYKGPLLCGIALAFQYFASYTDQTVANSLRSMRQQVYSLAGNLEDLKVSVLSSLSQLDTNLSFRSIDQDIYILMNLVKQYQRYDNLANLILYKQICGSKLENCNNAVVSLSNGLSNYLKSVKNSSGWSRNQITQQYITYGSILLNAVQVLIELNLRIAVTDLKLDVNTMTQIQQYRYSHALNLFNAINELNTNFDNIIGSTYDTSTQGISIGLKSWNDLIKIQNGLLLGLYRNVVGDQLNSITQTSVADRYITQDNTMIVNVGGVLDSNNNWATCPKHSFLRSIYVSDKYYLYNIETIQCVSFVGQFYDQCTVVDVPGFQSTNSWATCGNGKYVAGFLRGDGQVITNIKSLYCCSLTSTVPSDIQNSQKNTVEYQSSYKSKADVDLTNNSKLPVSYMKITNRDLTGVFKSGYINSGFEVESTKQADVLKTFDNANSSGRCPQDTLLNGFYQNSGVSFSLIEKLNCTKFKNLYWEKCFEQDVKEYQSNKSCSGNNNCPPLTLKCEEGSYLAGFRRGDENNMYGVSRIICCFMTNQTGQFKE